MRFSRILPGLILLLSSLLAANLQADEAKIKVISIVIRFTGKGDDAIEYFLNGKHLGRGPAILAELAKQVQNSGATHVVLLNDPLAVPKRPGYGPAPRDDGVDPILQKAFVGKVVMQTDCSREAKQFRTVFVREENKRWVYYYDGLRTESVDIIIPDPEHVKEPFSLSICFDVKTPNYNQKFVEIKNILDNKIWERKLKALAVFQMWNSGDDLPPGGNVPTGSSFPANR